MKKNADFWAKSKAPPTTKNVENKLKMAQKSGNLNLVSMSLTTFPEEINKFQELKLIDNWWEAQPILKLDCSNNLLESLPANLAIHLVILITLLGYEYLSSTKQ